MVLNVRDTNIVCAKCVAISVGGSGGGAVSPPQQVEGRTLVGVLGAKPPKNVDIYCQKDTRCSNFKFNSNIFKEYFYVHFIIILVGIDATC